MGHDLKFESTINRRENDAGSSFSASRRDATCRMSATELALFHRNTALPARLQSSGGAPRTSCVIPEPRLLKLHSRFPTDHSDVSPGVHPHRHLPSCHQPNGYRPRLDKMKMVSARAPHWRGAQAQAQWLLKRGCRLLLLLMVLTFDYPLPF